MWAEVAASPLVASATSAATETQFDVLAIFFCRLMTMLPRVALAEPVLVTVTTPNTERTVSLVASRVAATVQEIVGGSSGKGMLCAPGAFPNDQVVLFA